MWEEIIAIHTETKYCMKLAVTLLGKGLALSPRAQHSEMIVALDCGIPSMAFTQADMKGNRTVCQHQQLVSH